MALEYVPDIIVWRIIFRHGSFFERPAWMVNFWMLTNFDFNFNYSHPLTVRIVSETVLILLPNLLSTKFPDGVCLSFWNVTTFTAPPVLLWKNFGISSWDVCSSFELEWFDWRLYIYILWMFSLNVFAFSTVCFALNLFWLCSSHFCCMYVSLVFQLCVDTSLSIFVVNLNGRSRKSRRLHRLLCTHVISGRTPCDGASVLSGVKLPQMYNLPLKSRLSTFCCYNHTNIFPVNVTNGFESVFSLLMHLKFLYLQCSHVFCERIFPSPTFLFEFNK